MSERLTPPNPTKANELKGTNGTELNTNTNPDFAGRFTEHGNAGNTIGQLNVVEPGNEATDYERIKLIQERNAKLEDLHALNRKLNGEG